MNEYETGRTDEKPESEGNGRPSLAMTRTSSTSSTRKGHGPPVL